MRRLLRASSLLALALLLAWVGALGWFVAASMIAAADPGTATDAVVVLTGGRQRLEAGLRLLAAGKAKKLFISGVNQRVDREELLHVLGPAATRETCCIALGHDADNTLGNAHETAGWMQREGYRSLRLVTSWYHIERGLIEFRRAMPAVAIIAHPVFAPLDTERWWSWHGAPMVILREYHKYLAALIRPLVEAALPAQFAAAPSHPVIETGSTAGDAER